MPMKPLPHRYDVQARGEATGPVTLESPGLAPLRSGPPPHFDGPGDVWSPETLFVAAVADCFILTFRGVARASAFAWNRLRCDAEGVLARVEGQLRFTEITLRAQLEVPPAADTERAERLLEKAERSCLITASLQSQVRLESQVVRATV